MKTKESRGGGEKRRMEYLANGVTCRHTNMVNIFFSIFRSICPPWCRNMPRNIHMTHSRMFQKVESDFQSGSRVLKKVFWTFSYLYLCHTMWFHAKKLLKTLIFWKSLNSLCKSGSRPQKSPKKAQKTDHSIAIYSNFWIGMVYFGCHLVNPHVQTVQNMYGKGG